MRLLLTAAAIAALAGPATAAELLLGAYGHDITFLGETFGVGAAGREDGVDIHVGVRSERVEALAMIGGPQAHAFLSLNSENTSNYVAAGLSWPIAITEKLYFRPGLGLAYTDGETDLPPVNAPGLTPAEIARRLHLYNTRIDFGSQVLFQPELSLGYRFNDRWSGELSWVHISNGQIFASGKNQGMDQAGLRLSRRF
ncbi:acyloxyacyl hydrolase [Phenylobacterium sp.]|uniref:acyloxyacyl hydrolase n=1 Tax=Phenylobacterium sp. TaxID=1871053 RepID=UPI002732C5C3|nr:acyloxyacyl hydrolase [Phenylobacterium sp.]MDP3852161.1 acyloxyacyl hydrolase [Phenylobacterium sp.]